MRGAVLFRWGAHRSPFEDVLSAGDEADDGGGEDGSTRASDGDNSDVRRPARTNGRGQLKELSLLSRASVSLTLVFTQAVATR